MTCGLKRRLLSVLVRVENTRGLLLPLELIGCERVRVRVENMRPYAASRKYWPLSSSNTSWSSVDSASW